MLSQRKRVSLALLTFSFGLILSFQNCGSKKSSSYDTSFSGSSISGTGGATFNAKNDEWAPVAALFNSRCLTCHGPSGVHPMDIFHAGILMNNAVLVDRTVPANSLLYTKLSSGAMPKGGTAFTADELGVVLTWLKSVTLAWANIEPVIAARCTTCHAATGVHPMDIFHPATLAANTHLVDLTTPTNSLIYTKIHSGAMPKGGTPLASDDVLHMLDWIQSAK